MLARLVELVLVPSRPWYRWFPSDYLGDTAHLSIEEDCLYRRLLDLHWKLGHLPADEQMLARLARFPQDKFESAWPQVRPFFRDPGGRKKKLVNSRMQRLLADCSYRIEQKRDAANARWNKKMNAPAMQTQSDPDPEARSRPREEPPDPSQDYGSGDISNFTTIGPSAKNADGPSPKVPSTKKQKNGYPAAFERLWGKRPHRAGSNPKAGAFRAWNARRKEGSTEEDMESGTDRYRDYCQKTGKLGTEYVMQLATFLGPEDPPRFLEGWEPPREPVKLTWEERAAAVGLSARGGESWPQFQTRIEQAERRRP